MNVGIDIDGGDKLNMLLYADDIANFKKELEMMKLFYNYSREWRFQVNVSRKLRKKLIWHGIC